MGDVADILGMGVSAPKLSGMEGLYASKNVKRSTSSSSMRDNKPKGMSREVFDLLGKDGLIPAVYPAAGGAAFKQKWVSSLKGKWIWTKIKPFSARRSVTNYFTDFLYPHS